MYIDTYIVSIILKIQFNSITLIKLSIFFSKKDKNSGPPSMFHRGKIMLVVGCGRYICTVCCVMIVKL